MEDQNEYVNCGDLILAIHKLEEEEPDGRKKEHSEWKEKINILFDKYNKMSNFAAFKPIK